MKTDDLIAALSVDSHAKVMPLDRAWLLACVAAVVLAALVFFAMLGFRSDIAAATGSGRFLFKFVATIALAGSALIAIRAASRPEGADGKTISLLALAPAMLVVAIVLELLAVPAEQWRTRMIGTNSLLCLTFIPLIGLAPLAISIATLKYGAPRRPVLGGAIAGVFSGGVAATFYAAHCVDDSPLFVAVWYTLAVLTLAALGAIGGKLAARW